jgi:hypothetical protein
MRKTRIWVMLLAAFLLMNSAAYPQASRTRPRAMARWAGKYPDEKFFNQSLVRRPLHRILSKEDYESIGDYNLTIPIKRVGDYLVTDAQVKYHDPLKTLSVAFNLKDGAVYVVFWEGEQHRKFSTRGNQFDLPDAVLEEMGLKKVMTDGETRTARPSPEKCSSGPGLAPQGSSTLARGALGGARVRVLFAVGVDALGERVAVYA